MQVIVVMHHEQPEVTMRLLVRAGAAYDPPGKGGTAALVASLLNQGTTTRSAREIADAIDSIGGALDTGAGSDVTSATVLVMKDSFDVGMKMLADVVRRPAFAPEEIERQRHADDSEHRRQPRGSRLHRARGAQPPDLRLSSVRIPG